MTTEQQIKTITRMMTSGGRAHCTTAEARRFINKVLPHRKPPSKMRSLRNITKEVMIVAIRGKTSGSSASKSKRKKIIYASRWAFTRGIWKRGYRSFHYEPDACPNSPYWMTLNNLPPALDGRFILFEGVHNYAIYENMNRIISLSKRQIKY